MKYLRGLAAICLVQAAGFAHSASPEPSPARYTADGRLEFPEGYREWIFVTSGLDMSYSQLPSMAGHSMFDNVFVDAASYREFQRSGTWAPGTMLVMETRGGTEKGSINRRGHYQAGAVMGVEVHVKDPQRYKGGWAFFQFENTAPATMVPTSEDCYSCHREHAIVDTTFVQFYPTLLEIATAKGTASTAQRP